MVIQRMRYMVQAANSGEAQKFRTFQFQLANTILHEVGGHLLVTYIGAGRPFTPPTIGHPQYNLLQHGAVVPTAEAGHNLERRLWRGTLEFYRNPAEDNTQVSHWIKQLVRRHLTALAYSAA